MDTRQIFGVCSAIPFIILGIVMLLGKGDKLIAGYNTASEEEREKVNIGRLRIVMMIVCLFTSVFLLALAYFGDSYGIVLTAVFFVVLAICGIIANTWAKKK